MTKLKKLKFLELKNIAFQAGLDRSLTRAKLLEQLPAQLQTPRWGAYPNSYEDSRNGQRRYDGARIVSIDMGIRNLAYCVLDVPAVVPDGAGGPKRDPSGAMTSSAASLAKLIKWERVSLTHSPPPTLSTISKDFNAAKDPPTATETAQSFTPKALSPLAYNLVSNTILPLKPTHILIERQRHRSGGSPVIQEWTLRVNLLEGMLWSVLETLRSEHRNAMYPVNELKAIEADNDIGSRGPIFPETHAVDPRRVGAFWLQSRQMQEKGTVETSRDAKNSKIEKAAKIAVAESFLHPTDAPTTGVSIPEGNERVNADSLRCGTKEASRMCDAFLAARKGKKAPRMIQRWIKAEREAEAKEDLVKLDDLADCLLQGMAWIQWELNRRQLLSELSSEE